MMLMFQPRFKSGAFFLKLLKTFTCHTTKYELLLRAN